jgi:hypothetical protein
MIPELLVDLFEDSNLLYKFGARLNIEEDSLSGEFAFQTISWPGKELILGDVNFISSQKEFGESADLLILFFSKCLLDYDIKALED